MILQSACLPGGMVRACSLSHTFPPGVSTLQNQKYKITQSENDSGGLGDLF